MYIALLPWGSRQWNSYITVPHHPGHWAWGLLRCTAAVPWGSGSWIPFGTSLRCHGALGNGTLAVHHQTAFLKWVVELLWGIATSPWGRVSGTPTAHCRSAWAQLAVVLLR